MRDVVTDGLEIVGALAIVAGVFLLAGVAFAAITFGVFAIGFGYLAGRRG